MSKLLSRSKEWLVEFFLPCEANGYRARIFTGRFLIYFFFFMVILKVGFAVFLYSFSDSRFFADITKTALVDLANAERAKFSMPSLVENPTLSQAAYMKARDMAKNGYFSHTSPQGVSPWYWLGQAGYDYKYAGENLAIGFVDSSEVQDAWAASPSHKANIVNPKYKDIGIAVLKANFQGNPATIVVQLFGSKPAAKAPAAIAAAAPPPAQTPSAAADKTAGVPAADGNAKEVMGASTVAASDSAAFKFVQFLAAEYFGLAQAMVYISLAFVILLLLLNFALKADFGHADLLAKALAFIAIMTVFALIDHDSVVALIPHAFSIR